MTNKKIEGQCKYIVILLTIFWNFGFLKAANKKGAENEISSRNSE
jgi:hypothetical protein